MGNFQDYRWFAARCLEIARASADPQTQAIMLEMARVWHRLADDVDHSAADETDLSDADENTQPDPSV